MLYKFFLGLNWFLGLFTPERVIAISTLGYLGVTIVMWWEIRRQGRIYANQLIVMERQIAVQEASFRQWISIKDWEVRGTHALQDEALTITIQFRIGNPTQFPITVERIELAVEAFDLPWVPINHTIGPEEEFEVLGLSFRFSEEMMREVKGPFGMIFEISGKARFMDRTGRLDESLFVAYFDCGNDEQISPVGYRWKQEKKQKQSQKRLG